MNLKNITIIALVTLIVLNGVLIYLLVSKPSRLGHGQMPHPEMPGERGNRVIDMVSERLKFDEDQKNKYLEMAKLHHKDMVKIEGEERGAIKSYLSYLKSEPDQVLSKAELQNIVEKLEGEKLNSTFKHFEDLKKLCREDQLKKIDTVIEEMMLVILNGGKNKPPIARD